MSKLFQVYGIGQALIPVLPPPLGFENPPTSNQTNYEIGQLVFTPPTAPTAFYLYGGNGNWVEFATNSGDITSILGTTNQITAVTASGIVTLSIPSAFIAPGSIASTTIVTAGTGITATTGNIVALAGSISASTIVTGATGVTATTGNITATAGNLVATAGSLQLNGTASHVLINASNPTTASAGFITLSGSATTTLTSSAITANSIILFSLKTLGTLTASEITYTTTSGSATITPAGSTDTSTYGYLIIN